jgi:hypothetical protein
MVSTYLSYNLITRDMRGQLDRLSQLNTVSREAQYYKDNIGKIKTVDEFLDDYRLFSYAMKAYGLEDMTYARAFMKKVLESDLADENSFANRLTDDRYRKFAAAFRLSSETAVVQTERQVEDVIESYKSRLDQEGQEIAAENAYFESAITQVRSVDDLLNNSRLRTYVLQAFGVDTPYWSKEHLTKVLTSDVNDPDSYVNTLDFDDAFRYREMAALFNFNADGSVDDGVPALDPANVRAVVESYTFNVPDRLVPAAAQLNKEYYEARIGAITNVDELISDSRLLNYVKVAYGLQNVYLSSTIKNILTSDLSDPNNYASTMGGSAYEALAAAFNFQPDGSVAAGETAQSEANIAQTSSLYLKRYDDRYEENDQELYDYFKNYIGTIDSVTELQGTPKIYDFVLAAFGFDKNTSKKDIAKALTSDLSDPNSFVNKQKDERYKALAAAFNFDTEGNKAAPLLAQSEQTIKGIAKEYVIIKTRYGNEDKKEEATKAATAYTEAVQKIRSVDDLLADRTAIDFVLEAKGLEPKKVSNDFLRQLFESDLSDPKSFARQQDDFRFVEIVASFNFDAEGNVGTRESGIQGRYGQTLTEFLYLQQSLEEQTGEDSPGARLALYFRRMMPEINTAYDILADTALLEVFRTAFSLPPEISSMDVDKQAALVERYMDFEKLQDPDELEKFINRFIAMYDLENQTSFDPVLSLFSNSSSIGISADTLLAMTQLKR